jgi:hypothetical protein
MADQYNQDMTDTELYEGDNAQPSYEEKMLKRVSDNLSSAKTFLKDFHQQYVDRHKLYFNALSYDDLKKENEFPTSFMQEQVDSFVGYVMDKLFYKHRPCTVVGVEDTDKADAEAKQSLMDWQDYRDKMYSKLSRFAHDVALSRVAIAQVDYDEVTERKMVGVQEPIMEYDIGTGQPTPVMDPYGQPYMRSRAVAQDVVVYRGPVVKPIDPLNWFITQDKNPPTMIRTFMCKEDFDKKPYYINQDRLKDLAGARAEGEDGKSTFEATLVHNKRFVHGLRPDEGTQRDDLEYIEWQHTVNQKELYDYLAETGRLDKEQAEIHPTLTGDEEVMAIVGMTNEKLINRLEETPFETQRSNVIVGVIQVDEDEVPGTSIADKIIAVVKAKNSINGMKIANMKQTVNALWVINKDMLSSEGDVVVNEPGGVIETMDDVNKVARRVEQQRIHPDLDIFDERLTQEGQRASGLEDIISGRGEPGTETLGESEIVAGQAAIRLNAHLKTFEETFIQPLYEFRNQINMQFLDQEYVYGIVGQSAIQWRKMSPQQIRANVDFVCESASRETNRLVITQQIIQLSKVIPLLAAQRIPVRSDKLLGKLCEQGFSWTQGQIREIFPSLNLPDEVVNTYMIQIMLAGMEADVVMAALGAAPGGASGGIGKVGPEVAQPRSQGEARKSMSSSNDTQVARSA